MNVSVCVYGPPEVRRLYIIHLPLDQRRLERRTLKTTPCVCVDWLEERKKKRKEENDNNNNKGKQEKKTHDYITVCGARPSASPLLCNASEMEKRAIAKGSRNVRQPGKGKLAVRMRCRQRH